ncbi:cytosine permease [Ferrovum sp.]|uniref:cytosine permease n=1 Tax=Ferrovum sp. TaxID=2609467 RepID=UPI00260A7EBC|nr:cytosine permease [Ferrovum sp.]
MRFWVSRLRRGRYEAPALHTVGGRYWYTKGWNVPAIAWLAIGGLAASLFSANAEWQGPFVNSLGGGDLSIFVGLFVAGLGYYATQRNRVDRELTA